VTEESDAELIACLRSDPAALDLFYRRHRTRVLDYARRRCRQPADVADLVAATFLAALASADRFDPGRGDVGPWLIGIASRQWGLLCRAERKQQLLRAGAVPWTPSSDDIARLEEQIDAARASDQVEAALDRIGPGHREVLWLIGHDGLTVREAAATLGISTGTFRVRLLRARRALRAALDNAYPGTSARSPFAQEA